MIQTNKYTNENKIELSEEVYGSPLSQYVSIKNSEPDHLDTLNEESCVQNNNKNANETPNSITNPDSIKCLSDKD